MKHLILSPEIEAKLKGKTPPVTRREVEQCFENSAAVYLEDDREEHRTDPPTLWFLGITNTNRLLKVIFVFRDGNIYLKSAYDANEKTKATYMQELARRAK